MSTSMETNNTLQSPLPTIRFYKEKKNKGQGENRENENRGEDYKVE